MGRTRTKRTRALSQSPQARWSRRKKRAGLCARCGEPRQHYRQLCDTHQQEHAAYMRAWRNRTKEKEHADTGNVQAGS